MPVRLKYSSAGSSDNNINSWVFSVTYGLVINSFIKRLLSTHYVLGIVLEQWFSIRGDFCPLLDPRDIWKHLETVLIVITRVDGTAYNE